MKQRWRHLIASALALALCLSAAACGKSDDTAGDDLHKSGGTTEMIWIWDPVERYVFREDLAAQRAADRDRGDGHVPARGRGLQLFRPR